MFRLCLIWCWTCVLHIWIMFFQKRDTVKNYISWLDKWRKYDTRSIWCAAKFRSHPAWIIRYMNCSCFLFAIAYRNVNKNKQGQLEMSLNQNGTMRHVYWVDTTSNIAVDFFGKVETSRIDQIRFPKMRRSAETCPYNYAQWPPTNRCHFPFEIFVLEHAIKSWRM